MSAPTIWASCTSAAPRRKCGPDTWPTVCWLVSKTPCTALKKQRRSGPRATMMRFCAGTAVSDCCKAFRNSQKSARWRLKREIVHRFSRNISDMPQKIGIVLLVLCYVLLLYFSLGAIAYARAHPHLDSNLLAQYSSPWPVALGCALALVGIILALIPIR